MIVSEPINAQQFEREQRSARAKGRKITGQALENLRAGARKRRGRPQPSKGKKRPNYNLTPEGLERKRAACRARKGTHYSKYTVTPKAQEAWKRGGMTRRGRKQGEPGCRGTQFGPDNPCWRGGTCRRAYPRSFSSELKEEIKTRQGHRCDLCGCKKLLHVHHVDSDKQNSDPSNLVALCRKCHVDVTYGRVFSFSGRKSLD